ncbi:MAG: hypothetical protein AB1921_03655 [Thermodesulfobacteriota bacterium]
MPVLAIRLVASLIIAFLMLHFFYPGAPVWAAPGLAALLLGLAYVKEAFNRKKDGPGPSQKK